MGHLRNSAIGFAAALLMGSGLAGPSFAGDYDEKYDDYSERDGVYRYVTAKATTGGEMVTAPVRPGRWGDEVRLPGGAWVDCEITCEYTLRRHTVDFWAGMQDKFVSPGYFRWEYDLDTGERRSTGIFR